MSNNDRPTLRGYFNRIVPDESVFSYLSQYQYAKAPKDTTGDAIIQNGTHFGTASEISGKNTFDYVVDEPFPYYYYERSKTAEPVSASCELRRMFALIKTKSDKVTEKDGTTRDITIDDLIKITETATGTTIRNDMKVSTCGAILRKDIEFDSLETTKRYIYYVAVDCRSSGTFLSVVFAGSPVDYCLGVAF